MRLGGEDGIPGPWLALAAGAGAFTLLIVGGVVALVLPTLQRLDQALATIEQALPILDEIRPEVDRIDDNVDDVIVPELKGFGTELGELGGTLEDIEDPIVRLEQRIARVQESLAGIEGGIGGLSQDLAVVTTLAEDLEAIRDILRDVGQDLDGTQRSLGVLVELITQLTETFDRVVVLLEETEKHVENLDQKTGPAPPFEHPPQ